MKVHTVQGIVNILLDKPAAIEKALIRLDNEKLWNEGDARSGEYLSGWVRKGNHLTGPYVNQGLRLVLRYVGYLTNMANDDEEEKFLAEEAEKAEKALQKKPRKPRQKKAAP